MTPEELAKLQTETKEAVDHLRKKSDEFGARSVEAKQAAENTEKKMAEYDKANAEIVSDIAMQRKAVEESKERIETLEATLASSSVKSGIKVYKEMPEYKALNAYAKTGRDAEIKALNTGNSTEGGYLVPEEMSGEMIRKITEISPVRAIARTMTVGKIVSQIPKRDTIPTAEYEGESDQNTQSQSGYGNETLTCFRLSVTVPYTEDLLMDSQFDLESEINRDVAEAFAQKEGNKFVLGSGVAQPEGFLANASIIAGALTATGTAGVLDQPDDLLTLTGELKTGYNPMFGFNRRTLADLRKLQGSDGHYLWQMGLAPDAPATIGGDPYILLEDMPDVAAGALAVIYGDFFRGYRIVDRTALQVIRDPYTNARQAQILLTFHRWNHGQVVLPEAFKALLINS